MKYVILITALSFFSLSSVFCTKTEVEDIGESSIDETAWTEINNWLDVAPFAGQLVAYKTNSRYFSSQGYHFDDPAISYGYIKNNVVEREIDEIGYVLAQCLNSEDVNCVKVLIDSKIENAFLYMRPVTVDEKAKIVLAYQADTIKFDYQHSLTYDNNFRAHFEESSIL